MRHREDAVGPVRIGRAAGSSARRRAPPPCAGRSPRSGPRAPSRRPSRSPRSRRGGGRGSPRRGAAACARPCPRQVLEQPLDRDAELRGRGRVGVGAHLHRALQRADHGDVEVVDRHRLARASARPPRRARRALGAALHLEVHVDLEHRERRAACGSTPRRCSSFSTSSVPSRPSCESGARRDREPEVEVVVAQVVVRHAGMLVDHRGGAVRMLARRPSRRPASSCSRAPACRRSA